MYSKVLRVVVGGVFCAAGLSTSVIALAFWSMGGVEGLSYSLGLTAAAIGSISNGLRLALK